MVDSRLFVLLEDANPCKDFRDNSKLLEGRSRSDNEPQFADWVTILECAIRGDQAQYVHPETKLTPLHLAVMLDRDSNSASSRDATQIEVIKTLLTINPNAASAQCDCRGFTPLMYACIAQNQNSISTAATIVKLLLEYNPACIDKVSKEGQSALDIHIITMSRLQQQLQWEQNSTHKSTDKRANTTSFSNRCTAVLKALTEFKGAEQYYSIPKALDLLYSCNALSVGELITQEETRQIMSVTNLKIGQDHSAQGAKTLWNEICEVFCAPGTKMSQTNHGRGWLWEFVLTMLRSYHACTYRSKSLDSFIPPFNAVHTASRINDFPLAFYMLLLKAYPNQVTTRLGNQKVDKISKKEIRDGASHDKNSGDGGLPLHVVAGWETSDAMVARKSMTLSQLLYEYPAGASIKNHQHQTPLSIALETGTSWQHGVRRLTSAQEVPS